MPSKLWEIIPLDKNYTKALEQIDKHLLHWSSLMIHKCKQRLTKITQYLIRMRKIRKKPNQLNIVRVHKKVERRERVREARAEKVALIDNQIKAELLERLKQGTYGDIYNFRQEAFNEVMDEEEISEEEEAPEFVPDEYLDEDLEDFSDNFNTGDEDEFGFGESDFDGTEISEKADADDDEQEEKKLTQSGKSEDSEKSGQSDKSEEPQGSERKTRKRKSLPRSKSKRIPKKRHLEIEYDTPQTAREKHTK